MRIVPAMRIMSLCAYHAGSRIDENDPAREAGLAALLFVKSLKGEGVSPNWFGDIPVCGRQERLGAATRTKVFGWFGEMASARLLALPELADPPKQISLLPIPSSAATLSSAVGQSGAFPGASMAHGLVHALLHPRPTLADLLRQADGDASASETKATHGAFVDDVLRWIEPMPSAHQGDGPRDPATLYRNLRVIRKPRKADVYVLIDDVVTSSGHIRACAARVRQHGVPVKLAICAGQTVYNDLPENPFSMTDRFEQDFVPA